MQNCFCIIDIIFCMRHHQGICNLLRIMVIQIIKKNTDINLVTNTNIQGYNSLYVKQYTNI